MHKRYLQLILAAAVLGSLVANSQQPTTQNSNATSSTKSAANNASPAKAKASPSRRVTFHGELALMMSAAPFGPSTKIKEGALEVEARPMPLAIDHDGKTYSIYITRQTKLDDTLKSGLFTSGVIYRVTGTVRENTIFATEIAKE